MSVEPQWKVKVQGGLVVGEGVGSCAPAEVWDGVRKQRLEPVGLAEASLQPNGGSIVLPILRKGMGRHWVEAKVNLRELIGGSYKCLQDR